MPAPFQDGENRDEAKLHRLRMHFATLPSGLFRTQLSAHLLALW